MKKLFIPLLILILISKCYTQQYGWKIIAEPRTNYKFNTIEFRDSLHGWCAGADSIYRTTDGGVSWNAGIQPQIPQNIYDISFADSLFGWATGVHGDTGGFVWHTTDGGVTWVEQHVVMGNFYTETAALSRTHNITVGFGRNAGTIFSGRIAETVDGGLSWSVKILPDSLEYLWSIKCLDSMHCWVTLWYGSYARLPGVLRTIDGGKSWELSVPPHTYGSLSFVDSLHGWGTGDSDVGGLSVSRTLNGGKKWNVVQEYFHYEYFSVISFVDTLHGWLFGRTTFPKGGQYGVIQLTTDGGYTWDYAFDGRFGGEVGPIEDGIMLDERHGWAVSSNGKILGLDLVSEVTKSVTGIPPFFSLDQNFPNPFNSSTLIRFSIPIRDNIHLKIYNTFGQEIQTVINEYKEPGSYQYNINLNNFPSGVYFYRLQYKNYFEVRKMILSK